MQIEKRGLFVSLTVVSLTLIGSWGCSESRDADDARADLQKTPAAVQEAAKKLIGDNKVTEISEEKKDGKTIYDVEFEIKGVTYAADIDAAGNILQREVDVDLTMVPARVTDAAMKAYPTGKLGEASIVTAADKISYSVETKVGGDIRELEISAAGVVTADAVEPAENEVGESK